MDESQNYNRIQKAIEFLTLNIKNQPSLDEVAEFVGLSPSHFQRIFTKWAGISPKQFLKYLTLNNAKEILKKSRLSLLDTTYNSGLSSTSRLHDLFVSIEKMTPAELRKISRSKGVPSIDVFVRRIGG